MLSSTVQRLNRHAGRQIAQNSYRFHNLRQQKRLLTTAFIGLGNMGLPMCCNLAKAAPSSSSDEDNKILAFDKTLPVDGSLPQNVQTFDSIENLVSSVQGDIDVVLTVLPNDAAVRNVILDLLQLQKKQNKEYPSTNSKNNSRTLFIDSSTIHPSTTRELNQIISSYDDQRDRAIVDAPMSGGVNGAKNGSLTFMVGSSNDKSFEQAEAVLMKMGKKVIRCGEVGMGGAAKLCNNLALGVQMIGICEAMLLGEEFGIDPLVLASVMNSSTAKCWSSEVNNPHPDVAALTNAPASKQYDGGFSVELMLKDMGLAVKASGDSNTPLPLSSAACQLYSLAKNQGHDKQDFGVLFDFIKGKKSP
jgi:3-hydroxyisobutyrate dehydrogenase